MSADSSAVNQRTVDLGQILVRLSARADTRQSEPFRTFIDFDAHTNFSVTPHELARGRTSIDARFGVVSLACIGDYLVAAHTDTTSLSRLGKVWSIVEADELGQVSIFKITRGVSTVSSLDSDEALPLGEKLFTRTLPEKVNCFKMSREGRIFLGMASGNIDVYDIQNPGVRALSIAAHGNSPVIGLELLSDDTVVSVSLDSTLRISSASTGQLIGGGKLTKRMTDKEIIRCFYLHVSSGRAFLGTSQGRLFVIDVSSGSPNFLHVVTINTYPIRCISSFGDTSLLVGCGPYLYQYVLPKKGEDQKLERKTSIQTADGSNVHACVFLSENIVAGGLGDGSVTIYNGVVPVYSRLFTFEKVNHLLYSDQVLWAGGDDGRIVEVIIPPTLNEDASYAASFVVPEEVEPKPISVERKIQDSPPKVVNPSCLKKSSALAEDDSDDDWKRNLFAN